MSPGDGHQNCQTAAPHEPLIFSRAVWSWLFHGTGIFPRSGWDFCHNVPVGNLHSHSMVCLPNSIGPVLASETNLI